LNRRSLQSFARVLESAVAGGRSFACLIAGDAELRRLNREFLGRDYAADVLSFPAAGQGDFLGDIAISLDRAREQAAGRGHAVEQEVGILMLHGVLHLIGFDHETDRGRMRREESAWRRKLALPEGLIERSGRRRDRKR